jgi:hypothetical protein
MRVEENLSFISTTGISTINTNKDFGVSKTAVSSQSDKLFIKDRTQDNTDAITLPKSPIILSILFGTIVLLISVTIIIVKLCKRKVESNQLKKESSPVYYAPVEALEHDQKIEQLSIPVDGKADNELSQSSEERPYDIIDTEALESLVYEPQSDFDNPQQSVVTIDHCPLPMDKPEPNIDSEGYQRPCCLRKSCKMNDNTFENNYLTAI